jgi:hypothetical protein
VTVDGIIDYLARPGPVLYHGGQGQAAIAVACHVLTWWLSETSKKGEQAQAPASGIDIIIVNSTNYKIRA